MRYLWVVIVTFFFSSAITYARDNSAQRIVSLAPSLTEELYLLGVEDKISGVTTYCLRPASARKKEKVGTVTDVSIEKIVSLCPDLVLTTSLTNPKAIEKIKNLGIKVVNFPQAESFAQLCAQFLKLGKLVGKEREAEEITKKAKERADVIKEEALKLSKPKVFIQIGARPLFTATNKSFLNDFIEFAGGINIASGAKAGLYSYEKVLQSNPDIIIIAAMGIAGEEKKVWEKYKSLNAVKNKRIYIIDSDKFCSPTPKSFIEALEEIVDILHPEK